MSNTPVFSQEHSNTDICLYEDPNSIPRFETERTALFTSFHGRHISGWRRFFLQRAIRNHAKHLLQRGYNTFIVSYGSHFGMIALEELVKLRDHSHFQLIGSKIIGECHSASNKLADIFSVSQCDAVFAPLRPVDFVHSVVFCSYALKNEMGIYYHKGRLPRFLLDYLKTL